MPFIPVCRLLRCAEVLGAPFPGISFFRQVDLASCSFLCRFPLTSGWILPFYFLLAVLISTDTRAFYGLGMDRSCALALAFMLVSLPCSPSPPQSGSSRVSQPIANSNCRKLQIQSERLLTTWAEPPRSERLCFLSMCGLFDNRNTRSFL